MDPKLFENVRCPKHLSVGNANFGALAKTLNYRLLSLFKGDGDVNTYRDCLADLEALVEKQLELLNGGEPVGQAQELQFVIEGEEETAPEETTNEPTEETTVTPVLDSKLKAVFNKKSGKLGEDDLLGAFSDSTHKSKKKRKKQRKNRQQVDVNDITAELLGQMHVQKEKDEQSRVLRDLFLNNRERPIETFGGRSKLGEATIEMLLWAQYQRLEALYERYQRSMYRGRSWAWFQEMVNLIRNTGMATSKLATTVSTATSKLEEVRKIHNAQRKRREEYRETRFKLNRGILYGEEHEKYGKAKTKMTEEIKEETTELRTKLKKREITKKEFEEKTSKLNDDFKTFKADWDDRLKTLASGRLPDSMKAGRAGHDGTRSTFQKKFENSGGYKPGQGRKSGRGDTEPKAPTFTNRLRAYRPPKRTTDGVAADKNGKPLTGLAAWLAFGKGDKQERAYKPKNTYMPRFAKGKGRSFHQTVSGEQSKPDFGPDSFPTLGGQTVTAKPSAWSGKSFKDMAKNTNTSQWTTNTSIKVVTPNTVFSELAADQEVADTYLTGFYLVEMRKMLKKHTDVTEKYFLRMLNGDVPKPALLEFFRPAFEECLEIYAGEVAQEHGKKVNGQYQLPEEFSYLQSLDDTVAQIMMQEEEDDPEDEEEMCEEEVQEQPVVAPSA